MSFVMECPDCGEKIRFDFDDLDGEENCCIDMVCGSECNIEGLYIECPDCGETVEVVLSCTMDSVWTTDYEEVVKE